jgi:hypothetical protein
MLRRPTLLPNLVLAVAFCLTIKNKIMSEQEILEGNNLIAKFMGIKIIKRNDEDAVFMFENAAFPEYFRCTKYNTYHLDWNMLMSVVEKIQIDRKVKEVSIRPGRTRIWLKEDSYIESPCLPQNSSITECWLGVIKFIIWHNSQSVS